MHVAPSKVLIGTALLLCCSCDPQRTTPVHEIGELRIDLPVLPFHLDSGTNAGPFELNYTLSRDTLERLLAQKGYRTEQLRSFHFIRADIELKEPIHGGMEKLSLYVTPPVNGASRLAKLDSMAMEAQRVELTVNRVEAQEAVMRRSMELQLSGTIRSTQTRTVTGTIALSGTAEVEH